MCIRDSHPTSHKMAAYNSFVHRLLTIPLSEKDYNEEVNTIKYIAPANGYKSSLVDKLISKHKEKKLKKSNNDNTLPVNKYISADYTNILVNELKKHHVCLLYTSQLHYQQW